jgi:hypothetical protein
MFLEVVITLFVAAYIAIVAFGHVLLFAALLKCLREDYGGGRRAAATKPAAVGKAEMALARR